MARPLRAHVPDGWYYVTARGPAGQALYRDAVDGANFLGRVQEFPVRFGVEVHAYVLMPDHYHLLLRTPRGNVSRAVQWLNTGYGIWWSRRHQHRGRVFRGRFKSILVEDGDWPLALSLHLHANPAAVKRATLDAAARAELLRTWKWSSFRAYAGLQSVPDWLTVAPILARVGEGPSGYAALAEARLAAESPSPWAQVRHGAVLGGADFVAAALPALAPGRGRLAPRADTSEAWARIVAWVESRRGTTWDRMCGRRGEWGRELAWWAGRRLAEMSLRDLGARAGGVHYVAVAKALERFSISLSDHPERAAAAADLIAHLRAS